MNHWRMAILVGALPLLGCEGGSDDPMTDDDGAADGSTGVADDASDDDDDDDTAPGRVDDDGGSTGDDDDDDSTGEPDDPPQPEPWVWDLPPNFPEPYVPEDNPMSAAKVELGRHLFYDTRLSVDGSYSCATCHRQELAFTDGVAQAEGATGMIHPRGSMTLTNVVYASSLAWANPELLDLETHAPGPMFGDAPIELGLLDEQDAIARIADEPLYDDLFAAAFPDEEAPMTLDNMVKAIASFQRTLISGRSPFDRWFYDGDESAISESAKRGWDLFNFPGECTYCHFGFNFTDATYFPSLFEWPMPFHNTGLYNEDGEGAYPESNEGLFNFTGEPADMGKFKSPTLRNIAVTGPYMHDGSIETLEGVLEHYGAGGRVETPFVDFQMTTFQLSASEIEDFVAFFESLTDEEFLGNPGFSDPWERGIPDSTSPGMDTGIRAGRSVGFRQAGARASSSGRCVAVDARIGASSSPAGREQPMQAGDVALCEAAGGGDVTRPTEGGARRGRGSGRGGGRCRVGRPAALRVRRRRAIWRIQLPSRRCAVARRSVATDRTMRPWAGP